MSVHEKWAAVMSDLQGLAKGDRNAQQGFNFRGIDAVMNALGPILREHKVMVIPSVVNMERENFVTKNGTAMKGTVVQVEYAIWSAEGECIVGSAFGEASDAGDKSTPKAMSVAFRTFLLQALCLPTNEPDPDSETHDRSSGPTAQQNAQAFAERAKNNTDLDKAERGIKWATDTNVSEVPVTIDGTTIPLGRYLENLAAALRGGELTAEQSAALEKTLGATEVKDGE